MFVYRCEGKDETGPYVGTDLLYEHNSDLEKYPTPARDNIKDLPDDNTGWQCGFISIEHMTNWFSEKERAALREKGYRFLKLETNTEVKVGNKQCIFHRKDAKIIEELEV